MANEEHHKILKQGVEFWNNWRKENPQIRPNLVGADLRGADLSIPDIDQRGGTGKFLHRLQLQRSRNINPANFGLDLHNADLSGARFNETNLRRADFSGAILKKAKLTKADLREADFFEADLTDATLVEADLRDAKFTLSILCNANLREVNLRGANLAQAKMGGAILLWADLRKAHLNDADLTEADLSHANLTGSVLWGATLNRADLTQSQLVRTVLADAKMTGCRVFGTSVWRVDLVGADQRELIITPADEAKITVDNLEVAQFIYLLLSNEKIRHVIDTITSKVVLILGRFTNERKSVLDAIREELRKRDYLPILFDFDKPASRDLTETISTLAHMARFIIADITDARSIPQELQAIVPNLPSVPVQPLLLGSASEYGMFEHFKRFPWVLEMCRYHDPDELIQSIRTKVIAPAEEKAKAMMKNKTR